MRSSMHGCLLPPLQHGPPLHLRACPPGNFSLKRQASVSKHGQAYRVPMPWGCMTNTYLHRFQPPAGGDVVPGPCLGSMRHAALSRSLRPRGQAWWRERAQGQTAGGVAAHRCWGSRSAALCSLQGKYAAWGWPTSKSTGARERRAAGVIVVWCSPAQQVGQRVTGCGCQHEAGTHHVIPEPPLAQQFGPVGAFGGVFARAPVYVQHPAAGMAGGELWGWTRHAGSSHSLRLR